MPKATATLPAVRSVGSECELRMFARQRGTSGDASGLLLAIIWSALLAATIAVAVRLHAVWPRPAAHLVTTPVMLLLLWLIFQSLDLLLPGTM